MASPGSINEVIPNDILGEIFFRCIPSDPLKCKQPDVTIAPMLLCHVSSHWRAVAFQNPYIWTHLYHVAYLKSPVCTFDIRDITFLRWWHERIGGLAPSLRLAFKKDDGKAQDGLRELNQRAFAKSMLEFMSTARYLNLDFHYNHLLRTLFGERPLSCPNLETLIMRKGFDHNAQFVLRSAEVPESGEGFDTEKYIPVTTKQPLRRVLLEDIFISVTNVAPILNLSNITHIRVNITITLDGWFSLLRESINLVYGSFVITFTDSHNRLSLNPPKILPRLQQLTFQNYGDDLQQSFLDNLHLPSLTALRVDSFMPPTIEHLHRILLSTPALRVLQLGIAWTTQAPLLGSIFIPGDLGPVPAPLSSVVPHLESIHFEGSDCMLDICTQDHSLVSSVLTGDWLQLGAPSNHISRVHLGRSWNKNSVESLTTLVQDLQVSMPEGVELALRPFDAPHLWTSWEYQHAHFTDEFEDLKFEEVP